MAQRPVLPNAPLAEVVCELRFHGDLGMFGAWAGIQRELRSRFPNLFVPGAIVGTSPLLQHVQLANAQNTHALMLSINSMAYTSRQYGGWEQYKTELAEIHDIFFRHVGEARFTRFGLRFVNILPPFAVDIPAGAGVLHPALKLRLSGWEILRGGFKEQPTMQMVINAHGQIAVRVHLWQGGGVAMQGVIPVSAADIPEHGALLDFDAFKSDDLTRQGIPVFLENAHDMIENAFFGLVTADYQKFMES